MKKLKIEKEIVSALDEIIRNEMKRYEERIMDTLAIYYANEFMYFMDSDSHIKEMLINALEFSKDIKKDIYSLIYNFLEADEDTINDLYLRLTKGLENFHSELRENQ